MTDQNTNQELVEETIETEAVDTEATEEAPKEVKPRETIKEPVEGDRKEPNPSTKKGKVFTAGRTEEGGSMEALIADFGCTPSNIRQHIAQCNSNLGFGYKIVGDTFWITGDATVTWEEQAKVKEEAAAVKKAEAAAKAKAKADAKASEAPVEGEAPESTEELPETVEEDSDFLE